MKSVKENISSNISRLRKENGFTQSELGERINYSDKAISKWERGEAVPDLDALMLIGNLFGVDIEYFLHEHDEENIKKIAKDRSKSIFNLSMVITTFIFIPLAVFIFLHIKVYPFTNDSWIMFAWSAPFICIALTRFFRKNNIRLGVLICSSLVCWTLLGCGFLTCLINSLNFWMIFLIGIPIQSYIFFNHFFKK